jgi:antitoxin ParD1/3/4
MKPAGQMTLTLTPELEKFVRAEVEQGAFASSSEYVRELIRERYKVTTAATRKLDAAIMRGLADSRAGRGKPVADAFAEIRKELGLKPSRKAK